MLRVGACVAMLFAFGAFRSSAAPIPRDEPGTIRAVFARPSSAAGATVSLSISTDAPVVTVRLFRAGPERQRMRRKDVLAGVALTPARDVTVRGGAATVRLRLGHWPSGLYFARLAARARLGFAPLIVRAPRLGTSGVAVVFPTNTWQAYNFRDVDGDGVGDTWYADSRIPSVDLGRPFLNRGVPPHFASYDAGFVRWLAHSSKDVDCLSDADLETLSGDQLAALYDLIVFPGHEEYVTEHVLDAVTRFRDRGGNLAFLSANTFFYRVARRGPRLFRIGRWRDVGRWEAPLVGAEYVGWFENRWSNRPYRVTGARRAPWLFAGTGLENGDTFARYGIEIDQRTSRSPPGTIVLARIPDQFGPSRSAEMTYYETPRGAKVFAAGVINFGGTAEQPVVSRLLNNLWARLSHP